MARHLGNGVRGSATNKLPLRLLRLGAPVALVCVLLSMIAYSISVLLRTNNASMPASVIGVPGLIPVRPMKPTECICRAPQACPPAAHDKNHQISSPAQGTGSGGVSSDATCAGSVPDELLTTDTQHTIAVVFGTRPEAIKLATVVRFLQQPPRKWSSRSVRVVAIATGQHASMLDSAMSALSLKPDVVMSLMNAEQDMATLTSRVMEAVGCVLRKLQPSLVIVQGDTVTAAAGGMAAFLQGIPVGHVEAGLRTYLPRDPYPEEILRTALSAQATLHFAPTQYAADVLLQSGVCASKIFVVGNTVVDALLSILREGPGPETTTLLQELGMPMRDASEVMKEITGEVDPVQSGLRSDAAVRAGQRPPWLVVTMHRRESFGAPVRDMVAAIAELVASVPTLRVLLPVHLNPNVHNVITEGLSNIDRVHLVKTMPYDSFVFVLAAADAVLTDSGGLQEESIALGKRLFVMRQTSERPEALQSGRATLVGTSRQSILHHVGTWALSLTPAAASWQPPPAPRDAGTADAPAQSALGPQGETLYPVSAALSEDPAGAPRARPAARLVFGDGFASARITHAALTFIDQFHSALGAKAVSSGATAALRDFMSCNHPTFSIASLQPAVRQNDHLYHDFTWHRGVGVHTAGHQRLRQRVECSAQARPRTAPERTFEEIAAMESHYAPAAAGHDPAQFGITVIVSVYRRPQTFFRLLWALGNQTHTPVEIWITTFGSKHEDEFRAMMRQQDPDAKVFKFVSGDPNFKYFGRFALASMAKTPYVALFDDDCIPGLELFASLLHMINVKTGDYNALLGMKGHGNVVEQGDHTLASYWIHWVYKGQTNTPVDLTGGVWFLRTEWVHNTWRELPVPIEPGAWGPWQTGEDFQLTYSLRKYLGISTYLFPQPATRPEVWGQSADYLDISRAGDTTDISDILTRRQVIFHGLVMKGYVPVRADTVWGEAWNRTNIAVVLSTYEHAMQLARVVRFLRKHYVDTLRVHVVLAAPPVIPDDVRTDGVPSDGFASDMDPAAIGTPADTRDSMLSALGITFNATTFELGVWDVDLRKLGRHARWRAVDLMTETQSALAGVLETLRPAAIVMPFTDAAHSPILAAVGMTAAAMRIPAFGLDAPAGRVVCEVIAYQSDGGTGGEDQRAATSRTRSGLRAAAPPPASEDDAAALCAPLHGVSYSAAFVNVVTNSEALLVQQLFDTLCQCERRVSGNGGAFARCPDLHSKLQLTEFRSLSLYRADAEVAAGG